AIDRITEVLDAPSAAYPDRERESGAPGPVGSPAVHAPAPTERAAAGAATTPSARVGTGPPSIAVRSLTFTYEGAAAPAMRDVSFDLPAGGVLGIVGPVGSGKTTLLRLLARLYPVPEGTIRIGEAALETMDEAVLRATVALVPQESFLFSMPL